MTASAQEVLEDCREAAAQLVDGIQGGTWRRAWILSVVLLRSVGHVLDKVDGARSESLRREIDHWWSSIRASKPEPTIFWAFIDNERNSILKEYEINAAYAISMSIPLRHFFPEPKDAEPPPPATTEYRYVLTAGPYTGRDQRDVLQEAIDWWSTQLSAIERATSEA